MSGWGQTRGGEQKGKEGSLRKQDALRGPEGLLLKYYSAATSWNLAALSLVTLINPDCPR